MEASTDSGGGNFIGPLPRDSAVLQSSPGPSQQTQKADKRHAKKGTEGRFDLKQPEGAENLLYKRPDTLTEKFESKIAASIVYLHKFSQPGEFYIVRGKPSITQLVSKSGPAQYMASLPDYQYPGGDPNPDLVWIHLPSNNMSWVEALATVQYEQAVRSSASNTHPPKQGSDTNNVSDLQTQDPIGQNFLLAPRVWRQRQYDGTFEQPSKQERFLQPLYSRIPALSSFTVPVQRDIFSDSESNVKPNSVIFMPFIHWEETGNYLRRNKCLDWMTRRDFLGVSEDSPTNATKKQSRIHDSKNARADQSAPHPWTHERANGELDLLSERLDIDAKLLLAYVHEASPLHVRRTLDQSFYYTLPDKDIRTRDMDQTLYRYTKGEIGMTSPRILMADQLWLWIIDEPGQSKTVITAFPQSWGSIPHVLETKSAEQPSLPPVQTSPGKQIADSASVNQSEDTPTLELDRSQFYDRIFSALQQPDVEKTSAEDLVCLIIDKCSGLFHPNHDEIDHVLDYLQVFALAIAKLADRQTRLHTELCTNSQRMQMLQGRSNQLFSASLKDRWGKQPKVAMPMTQVRKTSDKGASGYNGEGSAEASSLTREWLKFHERIDMPEDELADLAVLRNDTMPEIERQIEDEMDKLVDITEETECMKEIKDILDELNIISSIFKQQLKIVKAMVDDTKFNTEDFVWKYSRLYRKLEAREKDFETLMAEGTRVYQAICDLLDLKQKQASVAEAYSARQEAKESARQGKTILLFTIVTIIFLPLSFIAGIFSMNAQEINGFSNRSAGAIVGIMLPFSLGTMILALLLAYHTSVTWFLIGLVTWDRTERNVTENARKPPVISTPPAGGNPGEGQVSTASSGILLNGNKKIPKKRGVIAKLARLSDKVRTHRADDPV